MKITLPQQDSKLAGLLNNLMAELPQLKDKDTIVIPQAVLVDLMKAVDVIENDTIPSFKGISFNTQVMLLLISSSEYNFPQVSKISAFLSFVVYLWKEKIIPENFFDIWNMKDLQVGL